MSGLRTKRSGKRSQNGPKKNCFRKVFIDDAGSDYIVYYDGVITNANSLRVLTEEWGYVLVDCEETFSYSTLLPPTTSTGSICNTSLT